MLQSFIKINLSIFFTISLAVACSNSSSDNLQSGNQAQKPADKPQAQLICSALDFDNVTWPVDYTVADQVSFALALNITGSFEGHSGWTNLSNNFDGQGFSMGILNQNLGQGTIQPLLIEMRDKNLSVLENVMTPSMLTSMLSMLAKWEKSSANPNKLAAHDHSEPQRELLELSNENIDKKYGFSGVQIRSNSASVSWAKKTLYSDSKAKVFKAEWKQALKTLAGDPTYVSLQIKAARYIHDRTHEYRERLAWTELRSYLFLFDIVVQNGSLKEKHFEKYEKWLAGKTLASEEERMLEMLEIRVVDSHPKWQKDVRLRKTTVILGTGFVHGEDRNLPVEYCYDPIVPY